MFEGDIMFLLPKFSKPKIDYTFIHYCKKQINMYESLKDAESDPRSKQVYDGVIARYELMINEYYAYEHDKEYMKSLRRIDLK